MEYVIVKHSRGGGGGGDEQPNVPWALSWAVHNAATLVMRSYCILYYTWGNIWRCYYDITKAATHWRAPNRPNRPIRPSSSSGSSSWMHWLNLPHKENRSKKSPSKPRTEIRTRSLINYYVLAWLRWTSFHPMIYVSGLSFDLGIPLVEMGVKLNTFWCLTSPLLSIKTKNMRSAVGMPSRIETLGNPGTDLGLEVPGLRIPRLSRLRDRFFAKNREKIKFKY